MSADQRFVLSARIIGGVRRDKPKLKMFMVSVLWSDEAEVIIYRSFPDFRKFHRELKKKFPNFKPFRKNDRMIPKFNGKARRSSLQQKGSKKSVRQMKFLESYCAKLLNCDPTVTQSSEVTRFFTPKDHDLQTDFTKNTVMIMMTDDLTDKEHGNGGARHSVGNVTHPFVTQTYRCVASYETKDTKNRPFKVAVDEKLDVLIKDPAGWWLVENESKKLAWFPAPYLEVLDGEEEDDDGYVGGSLYCAVKNYSTKKVDEVSVSIGSVVDVLRKSEDGWWLIRFNGKVGYIPSMYLQPYNNPRAGFHGLHRKMHSSSLNLATSREPQVSFPPRSSEENSFQQVSEGPSIPARFQRAQSLDVLSDALLQTQSERGGAASGSTDSIFSNLSSSSDSSLSLKAEPQSPKSSPVSPEGSPVSPEQPDLSPSSASIPDLSLSVRRSSNTSTASSPSTESTESARSTKSEAAPAAPRVPPRPKTEEILTRCTSMTRKAAMVNKTLLQNRPQPIYSR
ncbi:NADPH oxidase organizer 1 [Kryptolebias marmoratus]|uniref:NADPH oxidase organizer 1b n=1 Tax=Kryptolebias marmoratus TaxID=37003 RepID=A0A3Q3A3Q6_KRYMA|nr:NADPH oxidase organizer 1 [Kryptolebias marmoratus]